MLCHCTVYYLLKMCHFPPFCLQQQYRKQFSTNICLIISTHWCLADKSFVWKHRMTMSFTRLPCFSLATSIIQPEMRESYPVSNEIVETKITSDIIECSRPFNFAWKISSLRRTKKCLCSLFAQYCNEKVNCIFALDWIFWLNPLTCACLLKVRSWIMLYLL